MEIFGKIHVSTSLFLVNFREKTLVKQKVVRSALFDPGAKKSPSVREGDGYICLYWKKIGTLNADLLP